MKNRTRKINTILIPKEQSTWSDEKSNSVIGLPEPYCEGFIQITAQEIKIKGIEYIKYEYIPCDANLCTGGNAERIRGNKIRYFAEGAAISLES